MSAFFSQIELDKIVTYRNVICERLSQPVVTLDELNSAFKLLQELGDMENTIDDLYLPVENIYAKLRYCSCTRRRPQYCISHEPCDNIIEYKRIQEMLLKSKFRMTNVDKLAPVQWFSTVHVYATLIPIPSCIFFVVLPKYRAWFISC